MSDDVKKVFMSYNEFSKVMNRLVDALTMGFDDPSDYFDYVIGLPRGGLPIAVHLSHKLEIPMSDLNYMPHPKKGRILLVDDVLDTGKVMSSALEQLTHLEVYVIVLHWKPHCPITPYLYVEKTKDWVVYPWERPDEKPNRDMYKHL